MKLTKILLLSTIVLGSVAVPTAVNAEGETPETNNGIEATETAPAKATTTGEFSVDAGKLTLDAAPDYNFGKHSIMDITKKDASLDQVDNAVKNHTDSHDGKTGLATTTDTLQVSDFRGAGSQWDLNAVITPFTNKDAQGSVNGEIALTGLNKDAKINGSVSTVWTSDIAGTDGQASKKVDQKSGAKLNLSGATNIQAGTYDAEITWTLANTAVKPAQLG